MPKRASWAIWYDDGSRFTSQEGSWEEAPVDGVLFVLETFEDGKKLVHMGADYYVLKDDGIIDFSTVHLERHLRQIPGWKFGRWASDEVFQQAHEEVFGCPRT